MKNIKIKIENEEHSIAVQSCLFYIGCKWKFSGKEVCNTKFPYMYIDSKGIMTTGSDPNYFYKKSYKEVTLEELRIMVSKHKLEKTVGHAPLTPAKSYDEKGNATHYAQDRINSIEAMERIFGTQAVLHFCEINAFKYRARIGRKTGESIKENLTKIEWYENAVKFYLNKLRSGTPIATDTKTYGLPWEAKDNEPEVFNSQGLEFETDKGLYDYLDSVLPSHVIDISRVWETLIKKYKLVKK